MNHVFGTSPKPGERILAVYDVDDICHPQGRRVSNELGFDFERWTSFYIEKMPGVSAEMCDRLRQKISSTDAFTDMIFYDGVEDILKPEELDPRVEVVFNTKSPSKEAAELKVTQLMEKIPELSRDKITSVIMKNSDETRFKVLPEDTFIFVDDSPYNLGASIAQVNVTMIKPWNTSQCGLDLIRGRNVAFFPTLRQINDFVYFRIKARLEMGI